MFIKPFMRGSATVKQAADEFGQPIQTMHYRVEQMAQAGMLEVAEVQGRRGRPIKHYRATAAAFQVATRLVPSRILEALENQISWKVGFEQALEQVTEDRHYPDQVVMYYLEADDILVWSDRPEGKLEAPAVLADDAPAVLNHWSGAVYLDKADAKAFQRELWELYERYAHRQGREKYRVHLGLAPSPK
ncbi:MAG: ArsR family transcriptional regulator [Meiothermus sp.]|nr:ArsR family transcriptional regulator [Meiothermus sp.]